MLSRRTHTHHETDLGTWIFWRRPILLNQIFLLVLCSYPQHGNAEAISSIRNTIRVASFNVALYRSTPGRLATDLRTPETKQIRKLAEIIQRVRPDVIVINEFDSDQSDHNASYFVNNYLSVSQNGQPPLPYRYVFSSPVNTGVSSDRDLNKNGKLTEPADALGYGRFEGQYGMALLSRYPIQRDNIRTFQQFLWKDMPAPQLPTNPETGTPFYSDSDLEVLRLSSKSHWDVPININGQMLHVLASHPTPPVFDGPEDRNGCRNHDEIRFWADYIDPEKSNYIYDDTGGRGGLRPNSRFVVVGDLNADPHDGDSRDHAIRQLTEHPRIRQHPVPASCGGAEQSKLQGQANAQHLGNPAYDTADFGDKKSGNLRVDYVLPAATLKITQAGVYWPPPDAAEHQLLDASDHRLVWVDLVLE